MESLIESPRVAFVSGASLPASSQFSFHRLILPALCIAVGISVGSATGLTLALVNASENPVAASSRSLSASVATTPRVTMNSSAAQTARPALAVSTAATPSTAAVDSSVSAAVESHAATQSPVTMNASRSAAAPAKVEVALNRTPDALKPATLKLDGKTYHVAKMTFVPSPKPEEQEQPTTEATIPPALNAGQISLDTPASTSLYTEGVLTVSDYSASTRTIQTSDGKTFVLGTTVAAGDATSWDNYRSDVHYRCDQNGSCVLMRAGVVAPDAKLI